MKAKKQPYNGTSCENGQKASNDSNKNREKDVQNSKKTACTDTRCFE